MLQPNRIVLRSPELTLKGRNRTEFEQRLVCNVRQRLDSLGLRWQVHGAHGRVYVDVGELQSHSLDAVLQGLSEVAGIHSLAPSVWLHPSETHQDSDQPNKQLIEDTLVDLAQRHHREDGSFAVRVNRVDKRLPWTSIEMERWLGQAVRSRTDWDRVDLKHPDCLLSIDVYSGGIYLRAGTIPGVGGLPVGTGGRVLALLSGGIDSPVAAFELARRGCQVDFLHLTATFAQQRDDATPVVRLARHLSRFTLRSRLFTAPSTHLDLALTGPPTGFEAIFFRRFLVRLGEVLALRLGARALVIGDSLGQVASQTLENLVSVYRATEMPILQPLIGANKQHTVDTARRIGTYDISIEPYKDCCALLALSPRTSSEPELLEHLECKRLPGYARLIEQTLDDLVWKSFECGEAAGDWMSSDGDPGEPGASPDTSAARGSRVATVGDGGESGSEGR